MMVNQTIAGRRACSMTQGAFSRKWNSIGHMRKNSMELDSYTRDMPHGRLTLLLSTQSQAAATPIVFVRTTQMSNV